MPSIHGILRRAVNGFNKARARRLIPGVLVPPARPITLEALGDGEGAWTVPVDLIQPEWTCFCVGVGVDASFDLALVERTGAQVYSFDPTPVAIAHMQALGITNPRHHFLPLAVWSSDTTLRFFEPMNLSHVNLSTHDIHGTGQFVEVKAQTLRSLMARVGVDAIDLLKIDIEGSWDAVIDNMVADRVIPKVFCVEFDTPTNPAKFRRAVGQLAGLGLRPMHRTRDNLLLLRDDLLS